MATLTALQSSLVDLPTIPETLVRVLRAADDPDASAATLAAVIRRDPPLAANVLRLANSVYYRRSREVRAVADAVALLGFTTVRRVAIGATVIATLARASSRRRCSVDYRELWRHGVAAAAVARHLAASAGGEDPELAFTGGLLHDLGKFVLNLHAPRDYDQVIAARLASGRALCEEERLAFGFDHAEAGAAMGAAWLFPADLVACCAEHHRQPRRGGVPDLVALADHWAHRLVPARGDLGYDADGDDRRQLHEALGIDAGAPAVQEPALRGAVAAAAEAAPRG